MSFFDANDNIDAVFLLLLQEQLCMLSVPFYECCTARQSYAFAIRGEVLWSTETALPTLVAQRSFARLPKMQFFSNSDRK